MALVEREVVTDLAADFAQAGAAGTLSLWWLGQAGFLLRAGAHRLAIDPYLSDSLARKYVGTAYPHRRMMQPPISAEALSGLDLVLCTHGHTDHMDAETLMAITAAAPNCRFVVPAAEEMRALERGVPRERLIRAEAASELSPLPGLTIAPLPSAHETLKTDASGSHFFLGYVISFAGLTLYHSGDCVPYPGLPARLAGYLIDLALLPVNGRNEVRSSRGVPGNFHLHEAVSLCRRAGIAAMLGHHFGMFDFNTIDEASARRELSCAPDRFDLVAPGLRYDLVNASQR